MVHSLNKKEAIIINYLKGIAIFLVIFDHVFSYYSTTNELSNFMNTLLDMIRYVHVPLFFVLAGFVCHKQQISTYYKKKITRVLIPFYFFTILKLIYSNCISSEFAHSSSIVFQLYDAFIVGGAYWFAYAICLIYLATPLFWERSDDDRPKKAIAAAIAAIVFNVFYYGMNWSFLPSIFQIGNTVFYIPFFLLGYIMQYYYEAIKAAARRMQMPVMVLSAFIILTVTFLTYRGIRTNFFATKFVVSLAIMYYLTLFCKLLPDDLPVMNYAGLCSWQLMLLDAFYKAILFSVLSRLMSISIPVVAMIVLMDFFLGLITCRAANYILIVHWMMGLPKRSRH